MMESSPWKENPMVIYLKPLNKGAFGQVYKARKEDCDFAVKRIWVEHSLISLKCKNNYSRQPPLPGTKCETDNEILKLKREVILLRDKLCHENVVRYFESWFEGQYSSEFENFCPIKGNLILNDLLNSSSGLDESNGTFLFIRMEFCDFTLKEWIQENFEKQNNLENLNKINEIFKQLLKGLEYIHHKRVIHRDLKPANIFLKRGVGDESKTLYVKIGDFGLAREVEAINNLDGLEDLTLGIGTPNYKPSKEITSILFAEKDDIYAAGLIFLEMINHFETEQEKSLAFNQIRDNKYDFLLKTEFFNANEYSKESQIIQRMTHFNSQERPTASNLLIEFFKNCKDSFTSLQPMPSSSKQIDKLLSAQNTTSVSPVKDKPISFELKETTENFVGRQKELEQLWNILKNKRNNKLVVICGLGGIGKSELVKRFIKEITEDETSFNTNCIWLKGESQSSLNYSILKLAKEIGLPIPTSEEGQEISYIELLSEIVNKAKQKESFDGGWVFVLDNVDEKHNMILPSIKNLVKLKHSLVIVTSRHRDRIVNEGVFIELNELSQKDATEFIQKSLELKVLQGIELKPNKENSTMEDIIIHKLCSTLHNLPLALHQAVAFIREQQIESLEGLSYGITDYLIEYQRKTKQLLGYQIESLSEENERTTLTTWNITIDKIKTVEGIGLIASQMLTSLAYLHPDGISIDFLKQLHNNLPSEEIQSFENCLRLLKSYSLVRIERGEADMHRLLQKVIQIQSTETGDFINTLQILAEGSSTVIEEAYLKYENLRQILTIWESLMKDDKLATQFKHFPNILGDRLFELGFYSQWVLLEEETLKRFNYLFPITDPDLLKVKASLGIATHLIGQNEKAYTILKETWETQKMILGQESNDTLDTAHNLALVLMELEKYDVAVDLYKNVLEFESKKLELNAYEGKDLKEILKKNYRTKHNLGEVLLKKGDVTQGMEILVEVLEWSRINLGAQHPDTLTTKNLIGLCYSEQKNFIQANAIYKEVFQAELEVLGEKHPDTLRSKHNLGTSYIDLGEIETGLKLLEEVLPLRIEVHGSTHPVTLRTIKWIQDNKS